MIELKEITYVRLGTADIELAEKFATTCLGLEVSDRSRKSLYLRSDERAHTLYYSEGNPEEQTVGFEVEKRGATAGGGGYLGGHGACRTCRNPGRMRFENGEGVHRLQGSHRQ